MPASAARIEREPAATAAKPSLRFRGRSYLALALAPELPIAGWLAEIDGWIARSPAFFIGRAVVLDLTNSPLDKAALASLLDELTRRNIRVMAIEGVQPHQLGAAMPPAVGGGRPAGGLVEGGVVNLDTQPEAPAAPVAPPPAPSDPAPAMVQSVTLQPAPQAAALIVDQPVRSGQSIVHPSGDVIVMGSVASGAEVVAGGSIHVYGALRGRAIAGASGQGEARIFCRKLEAELVAIDGLYKPADDFNAALWGKPAQIWLNDDAMMMAPLD